MNKNLKWQHLETSHFADALDSLNIEGALYSLESLLPGQKMIGPAYTVKYQPYATKPSAFQKAGDYIDQVPAGNVVVIDNQGTEDCTVWGGILTQVAQKRGLSGTVIYGVARDIEAIRSSRYPVFSCGLYMRSGKNRVYKAAEQCAIQIGGVTIYPGDMMVGDDQGVLAIPAAVWPEVCRRALQIYQTEQEILAAVQAGESLQEARVTYGYHVPWQERTQG